MKSVCVCVCVSVCERERVCVCLCMCVYVCVCVYETDEKCVCVREREMKSVCVRECVWVKLKPRNNNLECFYAVSSMYLQTCVNVLLLFYWTKHNTKSC